ncbi:MAG: PaaI family thioesterase, partial [Steroidobacter sp.]
RCTSPRIASGRTPNAMIKDEILKYEPPAAKLLGREVIEIDAVNGAAVLRYTAQPEFLNRHGTVQGGLLAAMLDSATALALYAVLPPELTGVTISLNVSFLKPAKLSTFTATAKLIRRDERTAETAGELRDPDGVLVATATATLRIVVRK